MQKGDMLSVKEFSKRTGIKESTLRYYDDMGLFPPANRGGNNSYRYYSPQQVITVNLIKLMSALHYPLKTINELAQTRTPENMMDMFLQQEHMLESEIRRLQNSYDIIRTIRRMILMGLNADENKITVNLMDDLPIILGQENDFSREDSFYSPFLDFCSDAPNLGIDLSYPVGVYFKNIETFLKGPSDPNRFFSISPTGRDRKNAGYYLVGYTRGYYGETGDLPERMQKYAKDHDIVFSGPVYNIFLLDEISVKDQNEYLLQVSAAIEPLETK